MACVMIMRLEPMIRICSSAHSKATSVVLVSSTDRFTMSPVRTPTFCPPRLLPLAPLLTKVLAPFSLARTASLTAASILAFWCHIDGNRIEIASFCRAMATFSSKVSSRVTFLLPLLLPPLLPFWSGSWLTFLCASSWVLKKERALLKRLAPLNNDAPTVSKSVLIPSRNVPRFSGYSGSPRSLCVGCGPKVCLTAMSFPFRRLS